jgi:hypothetical protein
LSERVSFSCSPFTLGGADGGKEVVESHPSSDPTFRYAGPTLRRLSPTPPIAAYAVLEVLPRAKTSTPSIVTRRRPRLICGGVRLPFVFVVVSKSR